MNFDATFDYVIVGAGSAGCVLTNRISAEGHSVCVLEAGPRDEWWNWKIHMPAALMYNLCDDKYNWYYHTEPQAHMNNRVMYWPRGRVLGGSSALNAMVYVRGHALDYDRWAFKENCDGWSYQEILPYFRRAETREIGGDEYRGDSGPLWVHTGTQQNVLFDAFIEAAQQAGYPFTKDMNGYQQEGVGRMDMTIRNGRRWSAAMAYLHPAEKRSNVTVETRAFTQRIILEGQRAVGVEFVQNGQVKRYRAEREVICSGGAINSPQLLMLSGIGPADHLREVGVEVKHDLPGVGQNLQEHLEMYIQQQCTKPITLYTYTKPVPMALAGVQWFLTRSGVCTSAHLEAGGFIRSQAGIEHPNLQFHFLPSTVNDHGRQNGTCHAYQVHIGNMRQASRGWIKLKSTDPRQHPIIQPNYLMEEQDRREFRDAVKLTREIFAQKAFEPFRGPEINPGAHVKTDAEIDAFVRERGDSAYHPSCTCKMGTDDMAVVDPQARVRGLEGLRIVDASIMPSVVSGNLNAPTIMVAEKCSDMILGKTPLPKANVPVYIAENWRTSQR
ncbi:choline dehydrogenase [Dongia soli]|uniref:Choline dehydrogenase n=1 Tax=Dongia soli TaxID=600628 RepID=A0ABU5EAF9_9PROT|nr:choline dehydrogenase [Dongia soli]MDY0882892.1 choline dehydrogenase [Dongia soli]